MKTIKIEKQINIPEIKSVNISNQLMGTKLIQSIDETVSITANLSLKTSKEVGEITAEDFITIRSDEAKGTIEIEIEDIDFDDENIDISRHSDIIIAIPKEAEIKFETENFFLYAEKMENKFDITSENGPVKMEDISGDVSLHIENGPVKLYKLCCDLSIEQENGPISADNLSGKKLEITSENGAVKMRACLFGEVSIKNENGVVYYDSLQVESGSINIENENGHIALSLSPLQGFSLEAAAELGQIKNSFMGENKMAFDKYNLEVGDTALKIQLKTENGMIKLTSSDMISGDYLKKKLEYIKDLLKDNSENGINEAHKIIGQLIAYLNKMVETINEEAVKEKIEQALDHLKTWKGKISDPDIKNIVNDSIESVSQEVNKAVQEAMKVAQEAIHSAHEKYSDDFRPHFDKHFAKGKDFMKHFKHFMPPIPPIPPVNPQHRAEAMQEAARIKILEMLESGKITSEEAERLLKAIH